MTDSKWHVGQFVWRECMTPDPDRARGFYGELFGWSYHVADMGDFEYPMIKLGERMLGGFVKMEGAEHPPHWISYVSVEDVDAAAARAKEAGGKVGVPPMDIPGVGRMAVLGDPDGAWLTAFRSAEGDDPNRPERPGLGDFCWETISAKDLDGAKAFYTKVLGWKVQPGPGGIDTFATEGGAVVADLQPAQNMPPSWLTYVVVEDLAAATAKAEKLGGKVYVARVDVPEVGGIGVIADPFGAVIGLFEAQG